MFERGVGAPVDVPHAIDLYRHACKQGNGWGCDQVKRLGSSP